MAISILNKIEYLVLLVSAFAAQSKVSEAEAYRYLSRYGALALCEKHYGPIANDRVGAQIARYKQGYITFDAVYTSRLFEKLSDPKTGLYFQSSGYVYSFLETELKKAV